MSRGDGAAAFAAIVVFLACLYVAFALLRSL